MRLSRDQRRARKLGGRVRVTRQAPACDACGSTDDVQPVGCDAGKRAHAPWERAVLEFSLWLVPPLRREVHRALHEHEGKPEFMSAYVTGFLHALKTDDVITTADTFTGTLADPFRTAWREGARAFLECEVACIHAAGDR